MHEILDKNIIQVYSKYTISIQRYDRTHFFKAIFDFRLLSKVLLMKAWKQYIWETCQDQSEKIKYLDKYFKF